MIENLEQLAKEISACTSKDRFSQEKAINLTVIDYTDNLVRVKFGANSVLIESRIGAPNDEHLTYPFPEDIFWKAVEWVQEESLDFEENEDEDEFGIFTDDRLLNSKRHEFYD